jgi:hypothetical protein
MNWHSSTAIRKELNLGRLRTVFQMKRADGCMGRLGGGWTWKLGAMGTSNELVLELFVCSIRFTLKKEAK